MELADYGLGPGDIIALVSHELKEPRTEHEVAVVNVTDDVLEALMPGGKRKRFYEEDIDSMRVVCKALDAIPRQSHGRRFQKDERVYASVDNKRIVAYVLAALQGVVVATQHHDGELIYAHALMYERYP